jgi:hypothetical protein
MKPNYDKVSSYTHFPSLTSAPMTSAPLEIKPPMREFWQLNATEFWRDVYVFFPGVYVIPSLMLYAIIFYECLYRGLAHKSSFYQLFCLCGIIVSV